MSLVLQLKAVAGAAHHVDFLVCLYEHQRHPLSTENRSLRAQFLFPRQSLLKIAKRWAQQLSPPLFILLMWRASLSPAHSRELVKNE